MKYLTLSDLKIHPRNVRATEEAMLEGIASLAASIASLGLLQSIVVQKLDCGAYGVLAGRRRLMAMTLLDEAGDLPDDFKIPAKVIDAGVDAVTAISLAENITQERMNPVAEYEAYAAMVSEGQGVDDIARAFGVDIRKVKERLSYGRAHETIRAAAKSGDITLDVLKAFASHPETDVQNTVFEAFLSESSWNRSEHVARRMLGAVDIRADSDLGAYVNEAYRAQGGDVVEGLFPEDAILKDRALAETIRDQQLMDAAEAVRDRFGFGWAECLNGYDHETLSAYGRIYPGPVDLTDEGEARSLEIGEEMDRIAEEIEAVDYDDAEYEKLSAEYERLEASLSDLTTAYDPEKVGGAGVIAIFFNGGVRIEMGMVRPEDRDTGASEGQGTAVPLSDDPVVRLAQTEEKVSAKLLEDQASERAIITASAVAEDPALAYDAMVFKAAAETFSRYSFVHGLSISFTTAQRTHSQEDEAVDPEFNNRLVAVMDGLDTSFLEDGLSQGEQFRRFRAVDPDMKSRILAFAVSATVTSSKAAGTPERETFSDALLGEAVGPIRSAWRPTAANYFSRVSKAHMTAILFSFGMEAEADEAGRMKKAALADYMEQLFATPFATLSPDQVAAIEAWTPRVMEIPATTEADHVETGQDGEALEDDERLAA